MSGWTVKKLFAARQKEGAFSLELKDWLPMLELVLWLVAHTASAAGAHCERPFPALAFLDI